MEILVERGNPASTDVKPVYHQIADQIRSNIETGRLGGGERLPTIRALASELGVNRDTVSLAYDLLARQGIVEATVGRGTFVRPNAVRGEGAPHAAPALAPMVDRLLDFERSRPDYSGGEGVVPLHSLTPDPSLYPVQAFRRSVNRTLSEGGTRLLVYGDHQGSDPLRAAIAGRLRNHGIDVESDNVVLCQGASQGISLAMRLYAEPGDWVAVEEPTYHNVLGVLVGLGLRAAPVPMTEDGPDLEVLRRTLARPEVKLFYTMPSFHNPLGTTTSLAARQELLDVAVELGKPVIEDAFEMDLRYDGKPVTPLAGLDRDGVVVHLFSFSKSLFPGLRVGSITARGRAVDGLLALKCTTDLSGALLLQEAVADFVASGAYDRHLHKLRKALLERREVLLESLAGAMPGGTRWTIPEGGYQVWVELPHDVDTRALLDDAREAGVLFAPGYQFHHDGRPSSGMRLTTALADCEEIRRGVAALGRVTRQRVDHAAVKPRDRNVYL